MTTQLTASDAIFFRTVSSTIAYNSNSDANAYVFLCSENDLGGVVGIAWVGGTCASSRFGMSSINEYLRDDAVTGAVSLFDVKIYEYFSKSGKVISVKQLDGNI